MRWKYSLPFNQRKVQGKIIRFGLGVSSFFEAVEVTSLELFVGVESDIYCEMRGKITKL